jgi:hypothetical protein
MNQARDEVAERNYQLLVLFDAFPHLDADRLSRDILSLEPQAQTCEVAGFEVAHNHHRKRVAIGLASLGDAQIAIVVHEWPLPEDIASYTIGWSSRSRDTKGRLSNHTCYALCTYLGEARPIERFVALYKVALGLINQGAVGIANPQTWSSYPAEAVREVLAQPRAWALLRTAGMPAELLVGFVRVCTDGELWVVSRGQYVFGLPELAVKVRSYAEARELRSVFNKTFSYLFKHGLTGQARQKMECILSTQGSACLRFSAPSPHQTFLKAPHGTLIMHF